MRITLTAFICTLCLLSSDVLFAQTPHNDCNTALTICDKSSLLVDTLTGFGAVANELDDAPCLDGTAGLTETNSYWIRFKTDQSGSFYFTVIPEKSFDDFDFAFYRLQDSADCRSRTPLRCMAAGPLIGGADCLGPTGLSPFATDTIHGPGCGPDDTNFLAAVTLEAGQFYLLCVQNYSSRNGFRIDFCGTALLGCEATTCLSFLSAFGPEIENREHWKGFYPNPLSGATITLDLEMSRAGSLLLEAIDPYGRTHARTRIEAPAGKQSLTAPLGELPVGVYWLRLSDESGKFFGVRYLIVGA